MPKITYYALVDEDHPPERPAGVVRRIHTEPVPTDEAFTRNRRWEPTSYLMIQELGRKKPSHVEITREQAEAAIARWR